MIDLGISPLDKDATITLMKDGRILSAIGEERVSRQKMHAGFPRGALRMALDRTGIKPADIDRVVYAFLDAPTEEQMMRRNFEPDYSFNRSHRKNIGELIRVAQGNVKERNFSVHGLKSAMDRMPKPGWKQFAYAQGAGDGFLGDQMNRRQYAEWIAEAVRTHRRYQDELVAGLREFGLENKLTRVEHHQTHVANAFYHSGYDRALVVTLDGYGTGLAGTISLADGSGIKRLHTLDFPYSLGSFYESVTAALGMRPDRHAGKVVGLAAWGDPEVLGDVLRSLFVWDNDGFRILRSSDAYLSRRLAALFPKIDLAAAYQRVLEEVAARYVKIYTDRHRIDTVVLSGGVAANVKLNQRIYEIPGVRRVYIHPNMGDGGCGTGAAILEFLKERTPVEVPRDVYFGPDYSDEAIETVLRSFDLPIMKVDEIEPEIARLIAADKVVARFNGRMEYGPRALGNRSILYQAKRSEANQWLNARLKRTEFMPFAPATLYEDRHLCYKNIEGAEFTARFMTITFDVTPWMKEHCPAAVHIDGTARPQLVAEDSNPSFYRILSEYKKLTGIPSVINTSFNMHEEPIICSPEDAVRGFLDGRLDYLAIGNYLVKSSETMDNATVAAQAEGKVTSC
jgi:carbamoyltransferase